MTVMWAVAAASERMRFSRKAIIYCFATGLTAKYAFLLAFRRYRLWKRTRSNAPASSVLPIMSLGKTIDPDFVGQLKYLLKIMIPGLCCRESLILCTHSLILICRTFLSVYVATIDGCIAKSIVQKDVAQFLRYIAKFFLVALPATFVNSMIKYLEKKLGLAFRERLVRYVYKLYCRNQTYYRVSNLDSRLANVDQCMTDDLAAFADTFAKLYGQLTKPVLDVIVISITLFGFALRRKSNVSVASILTVAVVAVTAASLRAWSPKFGSLVAEEARRKGKLRHAHGRMVTNAEEIAFFNGEEVEHKNLLDSFLNLLDQTELINKKRVFYVMIEQFLMKYVWSATGLIIVAIPTLTATFVEDKQEFDRGVGARTKGFETAKNLLSSGASAVERLFSSYKEIAELSGYTKRVWKMIHVFKEVARDQYCKVAAHREPNDEESSSLRQYDVTKINGIVEDNADFIQLVDVPIVTPSGDLIADRVNFKINSGMHLLISGPNGCGKSSLFRILDGLWPCYDGVLRKPPKCDLFYVPQRPYMCVGTLRDQVIYPDSHVCMKRKNKSDSDLERILDIVHLNYVVAREGGWNAKNEWNDVLSGGEKQRLALARIFYHRPKFALLDECTSAVSIDVEGEIYESARIHNISLLTVTHRPSLWKYHTHILRFDGQGNCALSTL